MIVYVCVHDCKYLWTMCVLCGTCDNSWLYGLAWRHRPLRDRGHPLRFALKVQGPCTIPGHESACGTMRVMPLFVVRFISFFHYARLLAGSMGNRSKLSTGSCAAPWLQFPARCTPSSSLPTPRLAARCFLAVLFSSSLGGSTSGLVL